MIFPTWEFTLFFGVFFVGFLALGGRARKVWTLLASYAFYASWNLSFCALLLLSTVVDFGVARALASTERVGRRRQLLALSAVVNLGVLAYFKYCNFFVGSFAALLSSAGIEANVPLLEIVLPVGISFYTFQTLAYTIDVYRGELKPTRSLLDFAIYVAFFPQLVAGPIERAGRLLPQIENLGRRLENGALGRIRWDGLAFVALGAFKKAVLADNFAAIVETTYQNPADTSPLALWVGTYAFAIQIYCDFSGYSDMAVGIARLMGVDLVQNFRAPYAAAGPQEFWQRWHISLSTWLRDYLYIPLGGNRGDVWRTGRNLLIVMFLGGLWHGAAWSYVLWGVFHGALLVLYRMAGSGWVTGVLGTASSSLRVRVPGLFSWRPGRLAANGVWTLLRRTLFFHFVCLGWALFRARSTADCRVLWSKLTSAGGADFGSFWTRIDASGEGNYLTLMFFAGCAVLLAQNIWPVGTDRVVNVFWRLPTPIRFATIVALAYATVILSPPASPPFIYFQF